jgi:hypothetical protein
MCLQEHIDQQCLNRCHIVAYLVIPRRFRPAQFQPVQRRLAGQRRTIRTLRRKLSGQHRQHWIVPKFVVVVEVLVAQRYADHSLQHHGRNLMLHQCWHPAVGETPGKPLRQPDHPIRLTQQQRTGIRGYRSTIERRDHLPTFDRCKFK